MKIIVHNNASTYKSRCYRWLLEKEPLNNGLITIVDLLDQGSAVFSKPFWLSTVEQDGQVVGCALHAKPDGLIIGETPSRVWGAIFDSVHEHIGPPHRILAPEGISDYLAARWARECNLRKSEPQQLNTNCLRQLTKPEKFAHGRLRLGAEDDRELVAAWGEAYSEEKPAPVDVSSFMVRKLRRNELYLWDDSGPRTVVTLSGSTANGARISSVFTPTGDRGRGYASSAVATISENLLSEGKRFVTLVTRDGDESERMYQRLGYGKIGERYCFMLEPLLPEPN